MAFFPGLAPYNIEWRDYQAEEMVHSIFLVRLDLQGVPMFIAVYFAMGMYVTNMDGGIEAAKEHNQGGWKRLGTVTRQLRRLAQVALAGLSIYVLLIHCFAMPIPTKKQTAFYAQAQIGRWVYLTRHCLALQAVHQTLSLFSRSSDWLCSLAHGTAVWIAALGMFVTMQYFLLVVPSPGFQDECRAWHDKGVQFREVSDFLHKPAAFIAVADLLIVRDPVLTKAAFRLRYTLPLASVYTISYVGMLIWNYWMTGHWPYAMLEQIGTDFFLWRSFVCRQMAVIAVLVIVGWLLTWLRGGAPDMASEGFDRWWPCRRFRKPPSDVATKED